MFIHLIIVNAQIKNESTKWSNVFLPLNDDVRFSDLDFFNALEGRIIGVKLSEQGWYSLLATTTDGGANWDTSLFRDGEIDIAFIEFINDSIGLRGKSNIYKTTDGGKTWDLKLMLAPAGIRKITKISNSTFYAAGNWGTIIKSMDTGETWSKLQSDIILPESHYRSLHAVDTNTIYVLSQDQLLLTTDGGNNWVEISLPDEFFVNAQDLYFTSVDSGWVAGSFRFIFYTTDGGKSWINQSLPAPAGDRINSIDVYNEKHILAVTTRGAILRSDDAGNTWEEQKDVSSGIGLLRCQIINEDTAYAVGSQGLVLKTSNGGVTYLKETQSITPNQYYLSNNYPNPFNPSTNITFELPETGFVEITLYDIRGRELKKLLSENKRSGSYQLSINLAEYPSGVYLYTLKTNNYSQTKKMVLLK